MFRKNKYEKYTPTVRQFRDSWYQKTDCQPVGQRLPVNAKNKTKSCGIIKALLDGYDIGTITLMELNPSSSVKEVKYKFESIDGGHRKRALGKYLHDHLEVDGKFFSQLTEKEQESLLDAKLTFTVYKPLAAYIKGLIFRILNKTTDVNFIEMLNSYGDIPIANYIRETVRLVKQIDNESHTLFDFHFHIKSGEPIYKYLSFDNDRLKQDHAFARIVHRYITSPKELLGGSHDKELEVMYEDSVSEETISSISPKVTKHLDFLRKMADHRKQSFKSGLTQHDFKAMSYLYFYLMDTYKSFEVDDYEKFFKLYARANSALMNKDGKYADILHEPSGYSVQIMYKRYIAAPWDGKKIKMAIAYLIGEMGDIEDFINTKDTTRVFTVLEKEAKLAEQGFVCAIDNKPLNWKEAHAAHIVAYKPIGANGGKTVYSNLAMVRAHHNNEMGTMDLNVYKKQVMCD